MTLAVAIIAIVLLAGVVLVTTIRRRDTATAIGGLSRETIRRDRSDEAPEGLGVPVAARAVTGREVERAAVVERVSPREVVVVPPPARPLVVAPPDPETLGVTRRQFLNRGILGLFGLSLGGFGTQLIAILWPSSSGGFGGKVAIPASLKEVLDYYDTNKTPYYYAPGRVYISPYPKDGIAKAKVAYKDAPSIIGDMEQGIVALYQKCVHLGCRVPWCKTSQWFECPCHGSKYNRVGEKKGGPAPRGLDRFPVDISGGRLTVDTGNVVLGPPIGTNTTGQEAEGPHCVTVGE